MIFFKFLSNVEIGYANVWCVQNARHIPQTCIQLFCVSVPVIESLTLSPEPCCNQSWHSVGASQDHIFPRL
jgi:hypothetical protein